MNAIVNSINADHDGYNTPGIRTFREKPSPLGRLLKQCRAQRGVSQMALALECGVSQKHISFIESGRCGVSRPTLTAMADVMLLSGTEYCRLFVAAGFVPPPRAELSIHNDEQISSAFKRVFESIVRYPACVVDSSYNVLFANESFNSFLEEIANDDDLWTLTCGARIRNLVRLVLHHQGLRHYLQNPNGALGHFRTLVLKKEESLDSDLQRFLAETSRYDVTDRTERSMSGAISMDLLIQNVPLTMDMVFLDPTRADPSDIASEMAVVLVPSAVKAPSVNHKQGSTRTHLRK